MDYRDPESALRAKKEALQEELAETDRSLRELEAKSEAKKEPREPTRSDDGPFNVLSSVIAIVVVALGVAGVLVCSTKVAPWTFEHATVAGPNVVDPALERRAVIVTASIVARAPAHDDEMLAPGDEVALERIVETGHWQAAYRIGGRGGGEHPAGYSWKTVDAAPPGVNVAPASWRGHEVRVGAYDVDLAAIGTLPIEDLPGDPARVRTREGPLAWDPDRGGLSASVSKDAHPDLVLVRHRGLRAGTTVTVFGMQRGNGIVPLSGTSDKHDGLFLVAGDPSAVRRALDADSSGFKDVAPIAACALLIVLGGVAAFTDAAAIFAGAIIIGIFSVIGLVIGAVGSDGALSGAVGVGSLGVLLTVGGKAFSSVRAFLLIACCMGLAGGVIALAPYLAIDGTRIAATMAVVTIMFGIVRRAYGWADTIVEL